MKILSVILLTLNITVVLAQSKATVSCIRKEIIDSIRNHIYIAIEEECSEKSDSIRWKEHFSALDYSAYYKVFSYIGDLGISCQQIEEYFIIESYEPHEPFRYIYMVVKDIKGYYHVSKYDCGLGEGKYLGTIKRNYFFEMFGYISVAHPNEPEGRSYMLLIQFTNEKDILIELEIGVWLFTMNQLFLLEDALFD